MKYIKLISFVLAATVTVTCISACQFRSEKSSELIPISDEEKAIIEAGQTEGKDELEIAQDLIDYEDQLAAGDPDNVSDNNSDNTSGEDKSSADGQTAGQNQGNSSNPNTTGDNGAASSGSGSSGNTASGSTSAGNATSGVAATGNNVTGGTTAGSTASGSTKATTTPKPANTTGSSASGTTIPGGNRIPGGNSVPTPKPTAKPVSGKVTSTPTATPTANPSDTQSDYEYMDAIERECVRLINEIRKEQACAEKSTFYVPVVIGSSLHDKAHRRCLELADNFSHDSAGGIDIPGEAIHRCTATGADSATVAKFIVNAWKNSSRHYPLITGGCVAGDGNYASKYCGIGVMKKNGYYWCVFGISGETMGTSPSSGYTGPTNTPTPTATPSPVRVTYRVEGNGSITKTQNADGTVTLTAVPDEGWIFTGWYDHCWYSFSLNPTVTVTRDQDGIAIQAFFDEDPKLSKPTTAPDTPAPTTPPAETAPTEKPPVETDPSEIEI